MGKIVLTGDRTTGKLHLGHYVGSLSNRLMLQDDKNFSEIYIMLADAQGMTDNFKNPAKVRDNVINVVLDYLAVGLDPNRVTICVQSAIPALTELTFYYMNVVTVPRLERNPTVKAEMVLRGFDKEEEGMPVGFYIYPISQAADITGFDANVVPVGEDQKPMLEQCREIVHKFNTIYGETLVMPEIMLPKNEKAVRLKGLDGKEKMSKSLGNCIYLSEPADSLKTKVMGMYTDENHINVSDPGKVEGNAVFNFLDVFCEERHFADYLNDYKNLSEMKEHYKKGGLGDVKCKNEGWDVYYLKDRSGECDFVVCDGNKVLQCIQVSYDISSAKTRNREINGLLLAYRKTQCNNLLLLTDHEYEELDKGNLHIQIKPVYEWCSEVYASL